MYKDLYIYIYVYSHNYSDKCDSKIILQVYASLIAGQSLLLIIFSRSLMRSESKYVFFRFSPTCECIYFGSQPLHHISKPKLTEYLDRQSSLLTFLSEPQPSKGSMLPFFFFTNSLHGQQSCNF